MLITPALPIIADLLHGTVSDAYEAKLRRVQYLANVCLVLELDRSLSETYWLNVNDPTFPFVGVIEHTNFEPPESYGGSHIVYLSKYLPESDALYTMGDDALLDVRAATPDTDVPEVRPVMDHPAPRLARGLCPAPSWRSIIRRSSRARRPR